MPGRMRGQHPNGMWVDEVSVSEESILADDTIISLRRDPAPIEFTVEMRDSVSPAIYDMLFGTTAEQHLPLSRMQEAMQRSRQSVQEFTQRMYDVTRDISGSEGYDCIMPTTATIDERRQSDCACPACDNLRQSRPTGLTSNEAVQALRDRLNASQTTASLPSHFNPAQFDDAANISNGIYSFCTGSSPAVSETVVIRIHTVRSGRLENNRIIQRQVGGSWTGFASLQANGGVWIWSRYSDERGGGWHRLLNLQLRALQDSATRLRAEQPLTVNNRQVLLQSPTCNRCNTPVNHLGQMCAAHRMDGLTSSDERRWELTPHALTRQVRQPAPAPRRAATPRVVARPTTPTRQNPLMSAIDPTQIR